MKKIYSLLLILTICLGAKAQSPSFTITNFTGNYSLTCTTPSITLGVSPNTYSYTWVSTGGTFTSNASIITTTVLGNYTVTATNTLTGLYFNQYFTIGQNTVSPSNTVTPISQVITCNSGAATFTNFVSSPSSNVKTFWYSPGSSLPYGPSSIGTTTNSIGNAPSPGSYTVLTLNTLNGCSTIKTVSVTSFAAFPSFNTTSTTNFSLGCGVTSTTLCLSNATSTNGPLQYAFMSPTSTLSLPLPYGIFNAQSCTTTATAGTWTLVVQYPVSSCQTPLSIVVTQNNSNADFTYTVNGGGAVSFSSTSVGTNTATTYLWDFGDGQYGSGATTTHTYATNGTFNAQLITNLNSCAVAVNPITITPPCAAISNFTVVPTSTAQVWNAAPTSFSNVTSALWSWGDGSTSNSLYPSHTYSAAGLYNICLTVTTTCASTSSFCANYNIFKSSSSPETVVTINVVNSLSGIKANTLDASLFSVYPNPANNVVYIANKHNQHATIKVFNFEGDEVKTLAVEANNTTKLEGVSSGIYFLEIKAEEKLLRKKLIVLGN